MLRAKSLVHASPQSAHTTKVRDANWKFRDYTWNRRRNKTLFVKKWWQPQREGEFCGSRSGHKLRSLVFAWLDFTDSGRLERRIAPGFDVWG
jgi:hypothetical protein